MMAIITRADVIVYVVLILRWWSSAVQGYFCHEPMSGRLLQLVGCSVSHQSVVHMGLNTMVLWSFATPMVAALGVNQYLGFSLAAACSSAALSQLHSVMRRNPRGGLGASGILMGLIALTTVLHPEGQMHIIFLPAATISAPMALAGEEKEREREREGEREREIEGGRERVCVGDRERIDSREMHRTRGCTARGALWLVHSRPQYVWAHPSAEHCAL